MKKVRITALCAIILLILSASNNIIVSTIAGKLLTPYMVVGLIMAIASGFFGIYFGKSGGKVLHAIVSAIFALLSASSFLGLFLGFNLKEHFNRVWQPIFIFLGNLGLTLLAIVIIIFLILLIYFLFCRKKQRKKKTFSTPKTEQEKVQQTIVTPQLPIPKPILKAPKDAQTSNLILNKQKPTQPITSTKIKSPNGLHPSVPPCPNCGDRLESRHGPYGWFKACVNRSCGYTIKWKYYRRQNPL